MLFISYRRSDSRFVARALAECLRYRFGSHKIFLDESSIADGANWPKTLQSQLQKTSVLLALVGPDWLRCSDSYGCRRLDDPNDWVRRELIQAHNAGKKILIRLVESQETPWGNKAERLPDGLQWLAEIQCKPINDANWPDDVEALVRTLINEHDFQDAEIAPALPTPCRKKEALETLVEIDEIFERLENFDGWSFVDNGYPPRQELRKMYEFSDFQEAVHFMDFASETIDKAQHHPRWENQYRSVTVHFSTWEVGSRVTEQDFEAARQMDDLFVKYQNNRSRSQTGQYAA